MTKELYLDTANIDSIKRMIGCRAIRGVTTNPSLMSKEQRGGRTYEGVIDSISRAIAFGVPQQDNRRHLSVEVTSLDPTEMVRQAVELNNKVSRMNVDLFIKIPVMKETLPVISHLSLNKVSVNATACMTALQAKIAADCGARAVSFFYNRMKDGYDDIVQDERDSFAMSEIMSFRSTEKYFEDDFPMVICGSIREPADLFKCWAAGADVVTCSEAIIDQSLLHPQTTKAIEQFDGDIKKWLS